MKLAIIILSGDTFEILSRCLIGIKENVLVEYKIYLGYNGKSPDVEHQIRKFLDAHFSPQQFKIIKYSFYNFAVLNNDIVRNHLDPKTGHLLFCNNDVIIPGDCVNEMVYFMTSFPEKLGTVGCRLLFDNGFIQHDGQVLFTWKNGLFRGVTHINFKRPVQGLDYPEPRQVIGNTFALCLSTIEAFKAVGGLNEKYVRCYEDVEYNLRCLQEGFKNVMLPSQSWAYHLESYSRKKEDKEGIDRNDERELARFFHQKFINGKELIVVSQETPQQ